MCQLMCYVFSLLVACDYLAATKEGRTQSQQLHDLEQSLAEISQTVRTIRNDGVVPSPVRDDSVRTRDAARSPTGSTGGSTKSKSKEDAALAKLEHVRVTQMEAQQRRTERRIKALALEGSSQLPYRRSHDEDLASESEHSPSQNRYEEIDAENDWEILADPNAGMMWNWNQTSPGVRLEQRQQSSQQIPNTEQRRNVTKHRSSGRARVVFCLRNHRRGKRMLNINKSTSRHPLMLRIMPLGGHWRQSNQPLVSWMDATFLISHDVRFQIKILIRSCMRH